MILLLAPRFVQWHILQNWDSTTCHTWVMPYIFIFLPYSFWESFDIYFKCKIWSTPPLTRFIPMKIMLLTNLNLNYPRMLLLRSSVSTEDLITFRKNFQISYFFFFYTPTLTLNISCICSLILLKFSGQITCSAINTFHISLNEGPVRFWTTIFVRLV